MVQNSRFFFQIPGFPGFFLPKLSFPGSLATAQYKIKYHIIQDEGLINFVKILEKFKQKATVEYIKNLINAKIINNKS